LIFVRNQGDEGYCSSQSWDAGFEDYTFRLPWRAGMTSVDVNRIKTEFWGTNGTSGPTVVAVRPGITVCQNCGAPAASGVYVTFHLGPAVHNTTLIGTGASIPFINGALHLIWKGPKVFGGAQQPITVSGVLSAAANAQGAEADGDDEPEARIGAAIVQLKAPQQLQVQNARVIAGTQPAVHRLAPIGPVKIMAQPPVTPKVLDRHAIDAGPATRKMQRDAAQMRALCAATNNAPTGLPASACGSK
jgi:hypothetical protein